MIMMMLQRIPNLLGIMMMLRRRRRTRRMLFIRVYPPKTVPWTLPNILPEEEDEEA